MKAVREADALDKKGQSSAARDKIIQARAHFNGAKAQAPLDTQAKISNALKILDGLTGGTTPETKQLPQLEEVLPHLPEEINQALLDVLYNAIQYFNPLSGFTGQADQIDEFFKERGLTTPEQVQQFIEDQIVARNLQNKKKRT